jgi:curved DNA-binding protein
MITGKKLRIAGKGESSAFGGAAGDLFIQAKLLPDALFTAKDYDLHLTRRIKLSEAILGTQIKIPLLDGKELSLKIPPGTKHKTKMRLSGRGLPHMKGSRRGDLFVLIEVSLPKTLTAEQKKLVEKLAETGL